MQLDPEQLRVAEAIPEGIVIARARAGSGKSTILRRRVPFILRYRDAFHQTKSKVLVMAFNNKIAGELAEYFKNTLSEADQKRVVCKTTHGQALSMLYKFKRYSQIEAEEFGVTKPSALKTALMDYLENQGLNHLTSETVVAAMGFESFARARGLSLDEAWSQAGRIRRQMQQMFDQKQVFDLVARLNSFRMGSGMITFDDFLPLANGLPAHCFQKLGFTDVIIDECQDLNFQQQSLVLKLMTYAESLTAVGDAQQAVNMWAGSDARIFDKLITDYKERPLVDAYVSTTYRCPEPVVELANKVLAHELDQTTLMRGTGRVGPPVEVITNGAAGMIEFLHQREASGELWSDMAVLFRWRREKIALEAALAKSKIPYVITDGSFFDVYEIQDILCYLRCMYEPAPDYEHWRHVIGHFKGLGAKTAEIAFERTNHRPFQNLVGSARPSTVNDDQRRASWSQLSARVEYLMQNRAELSKVVDFIIGQLEPKWAEFHDGRIEAIVESKEIVNAFREWVLPFVDGLELLGEVDVYEQKSLKDEPGINAIRLGTCHSSKGLEWPTVALWNVGTGLGAIKPTMDTAEVKAERMLEYVSVTRAKRALALVCKDPLAATSSKLCSHVPNYNQLAKVLIDWSAFDDPLADFGVG